PRLYAASALPASAARRSARRAVTISPSRNRRSPFARRVAISCAGSDAVEFVAASLCIPAALFGERTAVSIGEADSAPLTGIALESGRPASADRTGVACSIPPCDHAK